MMKQGVSTLWEDPGWIAQVLYKVGIDGAFGCADSMTDSRFEDWAAVCVPLPLPLGISLSKWLDDSEMGPPEGCE